PTVGGGSFGLLGSVAIMLSEVDLGGTTRAYAAGQTTVTANKMDVLANDVNHATPNTTVVSVGAVSGAGAKSITNVTRTTEAYVGTGGNITLTGKPLAVAATSKTTVDGTTTGVS